MLSFFTKKQVVGGQRQKNILFKTISLSILAGVFVFASGGFVFQAIRQNLVKAAGADDFVTTWRVDGDEAGRTIQIPTYKDQTTGYDYTIDWGDGTPLQSMTTAAAPRHTYANPGDYQVRINGKFYGMAFWFTAESYPQDMAAKLTSIDQWGKIKWQNMSYMFQGCHNLEAKYTDYPDTSEVKLMKGMFGEAYKFNGRVDFDTSQVTDMQTMFYEAKAFNQPVNFNTSNVTNMSEMFIDASNFNQPVVFDTSRVESMSEMFKRASSFNQPVNFDTSRVRDFRGMFEGAGSFNQPVNFNTSEAWNMTEMFSGASSFNQPVNFDTSRVLYMNYMFASASNFNQPVNFDTSRAVDMAGMFYRAGKFNQDVSHFDFSNLGYDIDVVGGDDSEMKPVGLINFVSESGLSVANNDKLIRKWYTQKEELGERSPISSSLYFCDASSERGELIAGGWRFSDNEQCQPNRAPIVADQTFSLIEQSSLNTEVGKVLATDPDAGQALLYEILEPAMAQIFEIRAFTGIIRVRDNRPLKYDTNPIFRLTVRVTDNGSPRLYTDAVMTIKLTKLPGTDTTPTPPTPPTPPAPQPPAAELPKLPDNNHLPNTGYQPANKGWYVLAALISILAMVLVGNKLKIKKK